MVVDFLKKPSRIIGAESVLAGICLPNPEEEKGRILIKDGNGDIYLEWLRSPVAGERFPDNPHARQCEFCADLSKYGVKLPAYVYWESDAYGRVKLAEIG